jgi:murein DD-endopeptidase MepM/ murein hydrolase activator NlpD
MCAAALAVFTLVWAAGGTLVSVLGQRMIAERDSRLHDARIAYDDLLDEIAIYQRKVAEVTGKLRNNQADLVRQFAWADALEQEARASVKHRKMKPQHMAEISEARLAMGQHLDQLNTDLRTMTELDSLLKVSLESIRSDLQTAAAERQKGYQARAILIGQVKRLKEELRDTRDTVARLRADGDTLAVALSASQAEQDKLNAVRTGLQDRIAALEQTIHNEGQKKAVLQSDVDDMRQALALSRSDYQRVSNVRAELDVRVAALEGALKAEEERGNRLEADRESAVSRLARETGVDDNYNRSREPIGARADYLLDRLTMLHEARSQVIDTLNTRMLGSIEEAEQILGMTGLNVDKVLARVEESSGLGKGGPFIAALPDGASGDGFADKVGGLDLQLSRLGALQTALRAIPLVAPVDAFQLASGFGKRKDPIANKLAMHSGLDLSAPTNTPVFASAPGTVVFANWNGRYGRMIEIDHGFGITTRYGHLRKILVKKGQRISHREQVALIGSSGRSTGPHLHYEILYGTIPMDPMRFIKAGKYVFKEQGRDAR